MKKTKLVLEDQVNCRFYDLDPDTRRKIVSALSFMKPSARHSDAFKMGRWDGKVNFATVGGGTYINLLDVALPIVAASGYDIELVDQRIIPPGFIEFTPIDETYLSDFCWPDDHRLGGEPIILLDHQVRAINTYLKDGNHQSIQSISTSAGKTIITAAIAKKVEETTGGRTMTIVPNKSLVTATYEDFKLCGLDAGMYFGEQKDMTNQHIVCTWQSLSAFAKKDRRKQIVIESSFAEFLDGMIAVVVDECFSADTPVLTPTGYKPICEFTAGDSVLNFDEDAMVFKTDTVVKLHRNIPHPNEKMLEITLENGHCLHVTGNHKFLTNRGWVRADSLTCEDDLIDFEKYPQRHSAESMDFEENAKKKQID